MLLHDVSIPESILQSSKSLKVGKFTKRFCPRSSRQDYRRRSFGLSVLMALAFLAMYRLKQNEGL